MNSLNDNDVVAASLREVRRRASKPKALRRPEGDGYSVNIGLQRKDRQ
jgi:hypothetical protein